MFKLLKSKADETLASNFKYVIDLNCSCIFIRHLNMVTSKEIVERQIHIMEQPEHTKNLNRIIDLRGCQCDVDAYDVAEIAERLHQKIDVLGSFRQAMILDDNLEHGSLKLFASTMSDFTITYKVFLRNEPELKLNITNWIDMPKSYSFPNFISF